MFEYLDSLNDEQKEATMHIVGPLLIIAGAGSGKTTTLVSRVAYMVDKGIAPENILLLTFTNAAADNMKTRASKLSNEACGRVTACTYHSFCAEILRAYYKEVGLSKDFVIVSPTEEERAYKLCKSLLGYSALKGFPKTKDLMGIVSMCKNSCLDVYKTLEEYFEDDVEILNKILETTRKWEEYKEENNLVGYDDLLVKMYELLQNEEVRKALELHYKYVMVDEYQDTNKIQEAIVFALTKDNKNIVVVGDDYQSIYKFRGADISNIIEFPNRVGTTCKQVVIDTNYRSTKEILAVANKVMKDNADFGYPKQMKDAGSTGSTPKLVRPFNTKEEANIVLESIKQWEASGKNLAEYAVLERNSNSSARLEIKLTKEGIAFEKLGGLKFLEHQCVQDMLSFFKVVTNSKDELSWFYLLDIVSGIGEVYAHKIMIDLKQGGIENHPVWSKKSFYKDLVSIVNFVKAMERNAGNMEFSKVFDLTKKFYFDLMKKRVDNMNTKNEDARQEALQQLSNNKETVGILKEIAMKYNTISSFLDSIMLDATPTVPNEGKVVISTIHSAKGMEWEHVDILDMMDGIIPNACNCFHDDDMEDLRCLYVALTRAKTEMVVYAPTECMVNGKVFYQPSRFLETSSKAKLLKKESSNIKTETKKIYLNVAFSRKEEAKSLGARWDGSLRCWYILEDHKNAPILMRKFGEIYI